MDHRAEAWYRRRTTHWQEWPLGRLLEMKQRAGSRISVVIPARNEERTVAGVVQPLAGEWAARRSLMESLHVPVGYGVELASLLDTTARHGLDALAQVDLGSRAHKHQANHDLAVMAAELLAVAARRHGGPHRLIPGSSLEQFDREEGELRQRSRVVPMAERPPAGSVPPGAGRVRLVCTGE